MLFDFLGIVVSQESVIDFPTWTFVAPAVDPDDLKETIYLAGNVVTTHTVMGEGN